MNERCSFWGKGGNADKRGVISLIQCPQLLMHNEGLSFERAQAFFSLLELPVMLMITSAGITWSISDIVNWLMITGTAEDYQAVYHCFPDRLWICNTTHDAYRSHKTRGDGKNKVCYIKHGAVAIRMCLKQVCGVAVKQNEPLSLSSASNISPLQIFIRVTGGSAAISPL